MTPLLALFLAAVTVKTQAPLRRGCAPDADEVARLEAGAVVEIRFALAGEAVPCYKVAAQVAGKTQEGYLPGSALAGLEEFAKSRRDAVGLDAAPVTGAIYAAQRPQSVTISSAPVVGKAAELLESSQPARALELLEPELRKRRDPNLLALAGGAAWRADDTQKALEYWKMSLDLQPNPDLERLYRQVERESSGDRSSEKLYGLRVMLRYETQAVPAETARAMVAVLDEEFSRISAQLGCSAQERIIAIVQSREAFRKTTDAAEWSSGQFDGRIRIPVSEGSSVGPEMRRVLAHEAVHACLSMLGRWPAWLQEGLAQKLSGERPDPDARRKLAEMSGTGALPRLAHLRQDWSRMSTQHAWAAYQLSLLAVDLFFEHYREYGIRNLLNNPGQLPRITAELDQRLGL